MSNARATPIWRALPRALRWLALGAAVVLALVFALSIGIDLATQRWIRPLVEEQASLAIPGEVRIGGLDVSLLGLSVTLDALTIRPDQPDAKPVLEVGRLYVSLARLPLLRRRIVVKQIEIEAPVVRIVREASGELDLLKVLVPEAAPPEPGPETTEAAPNAAPTPPPEPIPVLLRRIELGAGRIEFLDRAQSGAELLSIEIPRSRIDDVVVVGDPGDGASDVHLEVSSEGASVELDGSFRRSADALDVDATAKVSKLPLARARVYLPDLGWSELAGELDAKVHYVHATGKTQTVDGTAELRGLRIGVPNLKEPALAVESLEVAVDQLDLLGRRLALGQVTLTKPRLFFDPVNRASLPLLPKGLPASGEPAPAADAPPFAWSLGGLEIEGAQLVPLGEGLEPVGLDASVETMASSSQQATAVTLTLTQADGSLAIEGSACASPPGFRGKIALDDLALAPLLRVVAPGEGVRVAGGSATGQIELNLGSLAVGETPAPGGDLHLAGSITLDGLDAKTDADGALGAKLTKLEIALQSLDLPGVLPPPPGSAAAPDAGRLRVSGTLRIADAAARSGSGEPMALDVKALELRLDPLELPGLLAAADAAPAEGAGRLRASGALALSGIALRSGKDGELGLDLEKLDLGLEQIELPGLLSGADAKGAEDPVRLVLGQARMIAPKLRVTRTETGIVLPELLHAGAAPSEKTAVATARTETKTAPKAAGAGRAGTDEKARKVSPGFRLEVRSLALEGASLRFVDRTVKPFYQGDVTGMTLSARDLSLPEPQLRDASLKLDAPGPAPLWALGAYTPASSWFELNLDHLPLAPLNPYVRSVSGYVVGGGELSLYSKGSVTDGHLYVANWVTLFDPDLSGGGPDAPLEKALGVPVSLAISLLKDPAGDIGLSIPIDYDEKGASVRLGSVIGSAVKGVLIGALTSPLKLLGAVIDASGRVKDVTPEPVHFLPGRVELAAGDDERVAALARLAAGRPGLELRLSGQTSGSDAQFLREALLLEAIGSGEGLPEPARGLAQTLVRRRLRAALEARLAGKPEGLEPEDAQRLDQWLAAVEVGSEALPELARKRAAQVQELLQTRFGLDAKQIQLGDPGPPGGSPDPAVDVAIAS